MRAQEIVTEVDIEPSSGFRGGKRSLYKPEHTLLTMIMNADPLPPGYCKMPGLLYARQGARFDGKSIAIIKPDNPISEKVIGELTLLINVDFPLQPSYQVSTITVNEDYRGQGIAQALYRIVLDMDKATLLAGSSQTAGGRKNWASLFNNPNVDVEGYVSVFEAEFDANPTAEPKELRKQNKAIDKLIEELMRIGWDPVGSTGTHAATKKHVFSFPVTELPGAKKELANAIADSKIKVYYKPSVAHESAFQTGLMARWKE